MPLPLFPVDIDTKWMSWTEFNLADFDEIDDERLQYLRLKAQAKSIRQTPGCSLPTDANLQARIMGLYPDDWAKVADRVLIGWILCDNGRLYHPPTCERVVKACKTHAGRVAGGKGRWNGQAEDTTPRPPNGHAPSSAHSSAPSSANGSAPSSAGSSAGYTYNHSTTPTETGIFTESQDKKKEPVGAALPQKNLLLIFSPAEQEAYKRWRAMVRRPLAPTQQDALLTQLQDFRERGYDLVEVFDQATRGGHANLIPPLNLRTGFKSHGEKIDECFAVGAALRAKYHPGPDERSPDHAPQPLSALGSRWQNVADPRRLVHGIHGPSDS